MRLQLTALLLLSGAARAGGEAAMRVDVYTDEFIEVVVPSVQAGWEGDKLAIDGRYVVDVLSGATQVLSADLVTSATTFNEVRNAGGLGATYQAKPTRIYSLSHDISHEPDYLTNATTVGWSEDLFKRMSTLSLSYGLSLEQQGRADDADFTAFAHGHRIDAGWDQILNKKTKGALLMTANALFCEEEPGCLANPYRYVSVNSQGETLLALGEQNPAELYRLALGGRLSRAVGPTTAIHGSYRYYVDTWKVNGHTGEVSANQSLLGDHALIGLRTRGVWQSASSFYRDNYTTTVDSFALPNFRTADRELSGLNSLQVGGRASYKLFDVGPLASLSFNTRLSRIWYRYPNFSEIPSRNAWVGGGGLNGTL